MQTDRSHTTLYLRKLVAGAVLALLALLLWPNRALISSWFATSYTASIRLTTTTETNDTRLRRAFDAARPNKESLELIPGLRQIRHSVVHVPGSTRAEAIATAEAFSRTLVAAFDAEGSGHLDVAMPVRAAPVPGTAGQTALTILTFGAPALGLFAIPLLRSGWCDWRARDSERLPDGAGYAVAGGLTLAIAPFVIPGWLFMALFAMAIPAAIAGTIVYKMRDVRRAAAWPSAQGRILHSRTRTVRRKQSDGSMTVSNLPDVEYAYSVDDVEYQGKRISLGEIAAGSPGVEAALARYQVGRTGPVYYNPDDPKEALLERDPPVSPATMYTIAAGVLLVGFAVVITFTRTVEVIKWLEPLFPPDAVVQGFLFCAAAGVVVLLFTLSDHRAAMTAARWPTTEGTVLSSTGPVSPHADAGPWRTDDGGLVASGGVRLPSRRAQLSRRTRRLRPRGCRRTGVGRADLRPLSGRQHSDGVLRSRQSVVLGTWRPAWRSPGKVWR